VHDIHLCFIGMHVSCIIAKHKTGYPSRLVSSKFGMQNGAYFYVKNITYLKTK